MKKDDTAWSGAGNPVADAKRKQAAALRAQAGALEAEALANIGGGHGEDALVSHRNSGIEKKAFDRLVREGRLPSVRLGRLSYVRRSALLGLVQAPKRTEDNTEQVDPYDRVVALAQRRRK